MERAKHYLDLNRKYLEEGESLLVKSLEKIIIELTLILRLERLHNDKPF
ncbi:MAG: hypothetical protein H3Z53_01665 [archaeon]|nr:hypothetical protein [archaeon]